MKTKNTTAMAWGRLFGGDRSNYFSLPLSMGGDVGRVQSRRDQLLMMEDLLTKGETKKSKISSDFFL